MATSATFAGITLLLSLKPHQAAHAVPPAAARSGGGQTASSNTGGPVTGTYTGDVVQTRYGPVQVRITVTGGRLTAVKVLQTPNENRRDIAIASFSVPVLTKEALAAGNARIDSVSGATYTSEGYIDSLQSALDKAGV